MPTTPLVPLAARQPRWPLLGIFLQVLHTLLENLPLLEEFGFAAEDFGAGCLMVRAVPSEIDAGLVRETLEMLAEKLLSGAQADPASARDAMLHTMACKAAIKGGWKTSPQELERVAQAVMSGQVTVNEALITGEADPITKDVGDELLSGSFVVSGKCRARWTGWENPAMPPGCLWRPSPTRE